MAAASAGEPRLAASFKAAALHVSCKFLQAWRLGIAWLLSAISSHTEELAASLPAAMVLSRGSMPMLGTLTVALSHVAANWENDRQTAEEGPMCSLVVRTGTSTKAHIIENTLRFTDNAHVLTRLRCRLGSFLLFEFDSAQALDAESKLPKR